MRNSGVGMRVQTTSTILGGGMVKPSRENGPMAPRIVPREGITMQKPAAPNGR